MSIELYELRMLVFMETEPQSNEYHQVLLDADEFKFVSKSISRKAESDEELRPEMEMRELDLSDETYQLPDLNSINEK